MLTLLPPEVSAVTLTIWALALITVCLRFLARRITKAGFWYDDWLMIPATLCATAISFISIIYITDTSPSWRFAQEICWAIVIWIVKYSILAFYWRLFSGNRRVVRFVIWALGVLVTCWGVAVVFSTIFQCHPVSASWSPDEENLQCFRNFQSLYLGSSITHIIIDVVLLGLPVPLIWNLQMSRSQKVMLTGVFAVGGFETVVSAYRLICLVSFFSGSYSSLPNYCSNGFNWTSFEANSAIICACLPSLRPILSFISAKFKQLRKHESTHKRGSRLLMDMLPAGKSRSSPVLPLSRKQSWNDGQHPMLDSSAVVEVEAMNPRTPELDAEAPGPHILEIGAQEPVLELECQRSIAELEGGSTSATRIR